MLHRYLFAAALLLAPVAAAQAAGKIRLEVPVPVVEGAAIDPEILDHCGIQAEFTRRLVRELRKVAVAEDGPIQDMQGRVLKVEIVDAIWGGNWFIEHVQMLRVRGVLYEDGARVAGFNGVMSGRGGGLTSGCFQMNSNFGAMTWYIKRWLRNPVDGANIGRSGA